MLKKPNQESEVRNWQEWAEIPQSEKDLLVTEARSLDVPVFSSDEPEDIFDRIQAKRQLQTNQRTTWINVALTIVSLIAAAASIIQAVK